MHVLDRRALLHRALLFRIRTDGGIAQPPTPPHGSCSCWRESRITRPRRRPSSTWYTATTAAERAFLTRYYVNGLAEFAYRNQLDLSDLIVEGPDATPSPAPAYAPAPGRPLIPFGGGIDSIVTVDRAPRPQTRCRAVHRASPG